MDMEETPGGCAALDWSGLIASQWVNTRKTCHFSSPGGHIHSSTAQTQPLLLVLMAEKSEHLIANKPFIAGCSGFIDPYYSAIKLQSVTSLLLAPRYL